MQSPLFRAVCLVLLAVVPAVGSARTIVDEWADVKAPPAPALKNVAVDTKTTALLIPNLSCTQFLEILLKATKSLCKEGYNALTQNKVYPEPKYVS